MVLELQPYVGPRPFSRADQDVFFGRDREANELLSLVIAHSTSLVFGKTGTGKSSLINATLIPLLEQEELQVLPIVRFGDRVHSGVRPEAANIYTLDTLTCLAQGEAHPKDLSEMTLSNFLAQARKQTLDDEDFPKPRVAIFDQFEDFFIKYPEHWQEREQFFLGIREALEHDRLLRVVFAIREDFIGELDPYLPLLPDRLRTRYRLEYLNARGALMALTAPLMNTNRRFEAGVAEAIVDDLLTIRTGARGEQRHFKGEYVDPLELQLLGHSLWQKLSPEDEVITGTHVELYGSLETALARFYEEGIHSTLGIAGVSEGTLRQWFEKALITPGGTRGIVYRQATGTAGISNEVIDRLEEKRLIKAEVRDGALWYELAHDRLIKAIQESNRQWLLQRPYIVRMRTMLEEQAREWTLNDRPQAELLHGTELLEAEQWLKSPDRQEASQELYAFVLASQEASREASQESAIRQEYKRTRWLIVALVITTLIALAALVFALTR
jgi:hypothetical protein